MVSRIESTSDSSPSKPLDVAPLVCAREYDVSTSSAGWTTWQSARTRSKTLGPAKTSAGAMPSVPRWSPPARVTNGSGATIESSSPSHMNHPVTACSTGASPVRKVVTAVAVVEGNTEVMVPRSDARSAGAGPASSCARPSPSTTKSTTCRASATSAGARPARWPCAPPPAPGAPSPVRMDCIRLTMLPSR